MAGVSWRGAAGAQHSLAAVLGSMQDSYQRCVEEEEEERRKNAVSRDVQVEKDASKQLRVSVTHEGVPCRGIAGRAIQAFLDECEKKEDGQVLDDDEDQNAAPNCTSGPGSPYEA